VTTVTRPAHTARPVGVALGIPADLVNGALNASAGGAAVKAALSGVG